MIFSSVTFLFFFLPTVIFVYFLIGLLPITTKKLAAKNMVLLAFSLLFYAWGEPVYVFLMILSIVCNYYVGLWIDGSGKRLFFRRFALVSGVSLNLALICIFKYYCFIAGYLNTVLSVFLPNNIQLPDLDIPLPVGISFFTFQALSYLVDVYRDTTKVQKNLFNLGLYISLFPQLIAGPIVRYHDVASQITTRRHSLNKMSDGCRLFIIGLGKKAIVANTMAGVADGVFSQSGVANMTVPLAWIGALGYTMQIYFDFSGYSDMAIGLGKMFGFQFLKNFNFPYAARSIRDFWQRWHISLSSWFRDYLYIPLGGSRAGNLRTYVNLLIVFLLCGLWHGASLAFVAWGLYHGCFLVLERIGLRHLLVRISPVYCHAYTMVVVIFGWVLFRADTFADARVIMQSMVGFAPNSISQNSYFWSFVDNPLNILFFVSAVVGSSPNPKLMIQSRLGERSRMVTDIFLFVVFIVSAIFVIAGTYNPFIYFRF